MPRTKRDLPSEILQYFKTASPDACALLQSLIKTTLSERATASAQTTVIRRRVKPAVAETLPAPSTPSVLPVTTPVKRRRRRMTANSRPPVSEATPIVPGLPAPTADEGGDTYEGN